MIQNDLRCEGHLGELAGTIYAVNSLERKARVDGVAPSTIVLTIQSSEHDFDL